MPKRTDIRTILVLGSGPIVIGQGVEFDYSGAQACKVLRAEGYRIVLVNSNPATIMTDPAFSDRTYIEPITPESVRKIIEKEFELARARREAGESGETGKGIDAVLPTLGGQTALNCACALFDDGTLAEFGIEMIGADRRVIHRAEDRQIFKEICESIGLKLPPAKTVRTVEDGLAFAEEIGLPAIVRPAFTLGGTGGGIAYNKEELRELLSRGLSASMIGQVQIDQSLIGWKEYELEVVRDRRDNCIIVCGIENIDAMGVHTGDSITCAPILTLTDKEYQRLRDAAFAIMRAVGVETGGSNVQFAVNPDPRPGPDGTRKFEFVVVEMNPRVSRSSALASKATGFPIAKIAAKLAVGYTLDELRNDVTGTTSACFEPTIDYIVIKMPRWTFEKFPEADETLTTQMKSVGEAMAFGRTFKEALQKVIRSMDVKRFGLGLDRNDKWLAAVRAVESGQLVLDAGGGGGRDEGTEGRRDGGRGTPRDGSESALVPPSLRPSVPSSSGLRTADGAPIEWPIEIEKLTRKLAVPSQGRLYYIRYAFKMGWSIAKVNGLTNIDPFFLDQIAQLVEFEDELCAYRSLEAVPRALLMRAKQLGYSDAQLANLYLGAINPKTILQVRRHRQGLGINPVFKLVDTCAAEFEARTPYYYSTYETGGGGARQRGSEAARQEGGGAEGGAGSHSATPPLRHFATSSAISVTSAEDEIRLTPRPKVIILGGGPNRIGQGIEFDYCCCHAAFAAKDLGFESVMINCNPGTVSTDYDTSDLLFFEPLTLEDVLNVVERLNGEPLQGGSEGATQGDSEAARQRGRGGERAEGATLPLRHLTTSSSSSLVRGLIVQFGGQTPLNLAHGLVAAGAPIIGTSLDSIDLAEDRDRFDALLERLGLERPPSGIARSIDQAAEIADRVGYPVLVRPSYVLGGRGMEVCPDERALRHFMASAFGLAGQDDAPILIDKFLDNAIEVDVDIVADFEPSHGARAEDEAGADEPGANEPRWSATGGFSAVAGASTGSPTRLRSGFGSEERRALVCGVMEHIEQAGIHSGDSACTIPPYSLRPALVERIRQIGRQLAGALRVNGLMNVQMAVRDDHIYILEVNPRASRTVPFVAKAKHVPWPAIAAKVMMGRTLDELGAREVPDTGAFAVKESVFPFTKFPGVDVVLGPEMRSTGEVMGIDVSLPLAYAKGQIASGTDLPREGGVFVSVRETDRGAMVDVARSLMAMGFTVYATEGTAEHLNRYGLRPKVLQKVGAGARPNVLDLMSNGQIALIINTPTRTGWQTDEGRIRATAVRQGIPMITTTTAAAAAVRAIEALRAGDWGVAALQDYREMAEGAREEEKGERREPRREKRGEREEKIEKRR